MSPSSTQLPLVTVITVVYNARVFLEQTIKNVIESGYPNLNYIIIDGGSSDGTIDIIGKYRSFIKQFVSEPDKGVYDAMNKGWKLAPEKCYILFLGAGDKILSLPSDLSPRYDEIVYGVAYKGDKVFPSVHNFKLKLGSTLHHQSLLIPKTLHPLPPFDLNFKTYADFDFNQRLSKSGATFRFSKDLKAFAMEGGISAVRNDKEMLAVVKKNYGNFMVGLARLYYKAQKLKQGLHR